MNTKVKLVIGASLLVIVTFMVTAGGALYILGQVVPDTAGALKVLRAIDIVRTRYIDEVPVETLLNGAIKGIVTSLGDPHSIYMDSKMYKEFRLETEGSFSGVGIVVGVKEKQLTVVSPIEGTPGEKAGIRSGDLIVKIDGKETKDMALDEAVSKIRGKEGTDVVLTMRRGETVKDYRVTRANIQIKTVSGKMMPDKIAYIRISMFNEQTAGDFGKKYEELEKEGMKGLVLDLRDNPGGLLQSCVQVSNKLVPKGVVVTVATRTGEKEVYRSELERVKYPAAVLVNGGSASASEIVAGAMQDTGSGTLFGTKTFGKGSVQSVLRLTQDTAIKLTIAKYATPNGRFINGIGIEPDVKIENPEPKDPKDPLAARPGRLSGMLKDDPNAELPPDLQLEAAFKHVKGKI